MTGYHCAKSISNNFGYFYINAARFPQNYGACIPMLVRRGADVNATNHVGYTPLHISAERGYLTCSQFLIECGAAVNFDDTDTR